MFYYICFKEFDVKSVFELVIRKILFRIFYLKGMVSSRERKFIWEKVKVNK